MAAGPPGSGCRQPQPYPAAKADWKREEGKAVTPDTAPLAGRFYLRRPLTGEALASSDARGKALRRTTSPRGALNPVTYLGAPSSAAHRSSRPPENRHPPPPFPHRAPHGEAAAAAFKRPGPRPAALHSAPPGRACAGRGDTPHTPPPPQRPRRSKVNGRATVNGRGGAGRGAGPEGGRERDGRRDTGGEGADRG